jgi:hypothetical protein
MEGDLGYFMRRAAQERSAASRADGKARKLHEQMAEHYEELAQSGSGGVGPAQSPIART